MPNYLSELANSFNRSVVEPVGNMLSDLSFPSDYVVPREAGYEYGSLLPARKNIQTGQVEWNPLYSNFAKSTIDAITAPGRAYTGQIEPNTLQGLMEAQNVAQLMAEGGFASGAVTPAAERAGTLGIFGGTGAKTADVVKLDLAQKLKQAGIPDEQIWKQTGWTSGFPDGKWRFEIPDNAASYKGQMPSWQRLDNELPIQESYSHADLYSAYPDTASIKLKSLGTSGRAQGSYDEAGNAIALNGVLPRNAASSAKQHKQWQTNADSTTLHELQHAIQQREGFARGGSPGQMEAQIAATKSGLIASAKKVDVNKAMQELARDPVYQGIPQSENLAIARALQKKGYQVSANEIPALLQSQELKGINSEYEAYKRLAGEAEARLTQARMNLTPEQRLAQYPVSQFDVPVEQQIVRYGDGTAMSVPKQINPFDGERHLYAIRQDSGKWKPVYSDGTPIDTAPDFETGGAATNWLQKNADNFQ